MSSCKRWCAVVLSAALLLGALPAAAESGNTALFVRNPDGTGQNEYVGSIAVVGDALYILGNSLYRYRPGDQEPETLLEQVWGGGTAVEETAEPGTGGEAEAPSEAAGEPAKEPAAETSEEPASEAAGEPAAETSQEPASESAAGAAEDVSAPQEPTYTPYVLVGGGETLCAIDTQEGMLGTWDEAGKRFAWEQKLDWSDMTRPRDDWSETREVVTPILMDGAIYMLVTKDFDNWGEYELRRFDLASGACAKLPAADLQCLVAYTPGKLAAVWVDREDWEPSVVVVDAATGNVETTLLQTENRYGQLGGLAYDAATGVLYVNENCTVAPVVNGALGEPVAFIPAQSGTNSIAAVLSSGHYVISAYDGIFLRNLDPQYKPAGVLRLGGGYMDDATAAFARANPDIAIQMSSNYLWTSQQIIDAMISKESNVDVFTVSSMGGLKGLREKGYLADISSSPALVAAVEAMYPQVRDALLVDGKLYGYPQSLSVTLWQVDEAALEKLGLGGMPETMMDFMDLIQTWVDEDMAEEYPEWMLSEPWYDRQQLLYELVMTYVYRYETPDQPLRFDTPELRRLLERWERLPEFGPSEEDRASGRGYTFDGSQAILISTSASPFFRFWYSDREDHKPSLVSSPPFVAGDPPAIFGNMSVYVVNPNSTQHELALRYLEYVAENGDTRDRYLVRPDLNEPVPEPYMIQDKLDAEKALKEAEEDLEKAEEADKKEAQEYVDMVREWLKNTERNYWQISAEDIATYRELAQYMRINIDSAMLNYGSTSFEEFYKELQRYAEGQIKLDELLRELDKKSKMIFYEGN